MKTLRPSVALLAIALLIPAAPAEENAEIAALRAKAVRGNGIAQYNLGLAYAEGRGVAADPIEAFVWLSLARDNGARGRALDALLSTLDRTTLAAAQERLAARRAELDLRPAAQTPASSQNRRQEAAPPAESVAPAPAAPAIQADDDPALKRLVTERDNLAARLNTLSTEAANLRSEREQLVRLAAEQESALRANGEALRGVQEKLRAAEARIAELSTALTDAQAQKTRELQAARAELEAARAFGQQVEATLNRVADEKAALEATLAKASDRANQTATAQQKTLEDALSEKTRELQATRAELEAARAFGQQVEATLNRVADEKAALEAALAKARDAKPAYPDLSDRVIELESQLAQARQPKEPAYPDLRGRVAELEAATAAALQKFAAADQELAALKSRSAAPAYPNLSGRVQELEQALATARDQAAQQAAAAQTAASKARDLEARVAALTAEAALRQRETASLAEAKAEAERSRDAIAKQFEDYKSSSAAALRENSNLQATVKLLESDKASLRRQAETAGNEAAQLRNQVASLKEQLAAQPDASALSRRVAQLDASLQETVKQLAAATTEADRANRKAAELAKQLESRPDLSGKVAELEAALMQTSVQAQRDRGEMGAAIDKLMQEKAQLSAALAEAQRDRQAAIAALQSRPAAPAYPDLRARVAELEAATTASLQKFAAADQELAALKARLAEKPAAPAYPDLSGRVAELESQLAAKSAELERAQQEVAGLKTAAPAYPDLRERVAELEAALAEARNAKPAYPDLSDRVAELETQLAKARPPIGSTAATERAHVAELEASNADLKRNLAKVNFEHAGVKNQLEVATRRIAELETQLANTTSALQAATKSQPDAGQLLRERDELANRVAALTSEITQLRDDRERMQKMLADAGRQMRDASADANRIRELETKNAAFEVALSALQTRITELQAAKPAAPAYPDLSGRVAELETQLAAAQKALAEKPPYQDLSGRVAELEAALARASSAGAPSTPAWPDLSGRVRELESSLADALRRLNEAEARATREPAAPAWPDLRERVAQLEAQLAAQPSAAASTGDSSELEKRLAEVEDRLATALRGYRLLEKERDALQAQASQADQTLAADRENFARQVAALTAEVEQLKATAASQAASVAASDTLAQERDALAARLAQAERAAELARSEAARANESLAALQRSSSQTATEAAATRALLQQLQGANAVLAQENYQLKTMLARTGSGPAPVAVAPRTAPPSAPAAGSTAPPATPGARTHTVVAGDSLSRISQRYYGTATRWQEIYNANADKLGPNGVLRIGTELRIP